MTAMATTKKLESEISRLWTVSDMERKFRVTYQTLKNWRRDKDLPTVCIRGEAKPALRFVPVDVRAWARQHGITIYER